jgi:hypothetical protein
VRADVRGLGTLPRPLSSFIGREDVLAEVTALIRQNRLLTSPDRAAAGRPDSASNWPRA